jgi:predicted Zn-ribbon and HTH transcriptional regulator
MSNAKKPSYWEFYKCSSCEHEFQAIFMVQQAPPCPRCKDSEYVSVVSHVKETNQVTPYWEGD